MNSYNGFTSEQRLAAFAWLKKEYAAGRRVRPTRCDACGQAEGVIEPHSEDYSFPYGDHVGAFGLCYRCHMMIHCRFSAGEAWARYLDRLHEGFRAVPLHTRNFGMIRSQLSGREPEYVRVEPRPWTVLDGIHAGHYLPGRQDDRRVRVEPPRPAQLELFG